MQMELSLECQKLLAHRGSLLRVWQWICTRLQIVDEMLKFASGRDYSGYGWVANDVLEEKLGPSLTLNLAGYRRQWFAADSSEQPTLSKRTVNNDGDSHVRRSRQEALFRTWLGQGIVHLYEV
jgi:hypothetical protein